MRRSTVDAYAGISSRKPPSSSYTGTSERLAAEVPQGDVDHAENLDRELLDAVELPQPVPEPLAAIGSSPTSSSRRRRSTTSSRMTPRRQWATPSKPSSLTMRSTPPTSSGSEPGRPARHRNGGVRAAI